MFLTIRGGMTSHAAVVARGMGRCCVSGCGELTMHDENKTFEIDGVKYSSMEIGFQFRWVTGNIYGSAIKTVEPVFMVTLNVL